MIESHVPSLEACKKLQEAGWKKETLFLRSTEFEWKVITREEYEEFSDYAGAAGMPSGGSVEQFVEAPLLSEILEELPHTVPNSHFSVLKNDDEVCFYYADSDDHHEMRYWGTHKNPAEAAALLWLALKGEGLI